MKITSFAIFFIFVLFSFFSEKDYSDNTTDIVQSDSTAAVISFTVVGDLMCHLPQVTYAAVSKDSFDFNPVYSEIKPFLEDADYTLGNLETILAGKEKKYTGYPRFNSPDEYLDAAANAGFDILFTSNNHAMDQGTKGIYRTIDKIREKGLSNVGTYKTEVERDSVFIITKDSISIALLSYTSTINGIDVPKDEKYSVNMMDYNLIGSDIEKAKSKGVDLVFVYFHFGAEYKVKPSDFQRSAVDTTIKLGADIILASHPHVLQPVNHFKPVNSKLDTGFVVYSLGNFVSNQRWRYSDGAAILNFEITKNIKTDSLTVSNLEFIPFWVYKGKNSNKKNVYTIFPSELAALNKYPAYFSKKDKKMMFQSYKDNVKIFTKESNKIKLKFLPQELQSSEPILAVPKIN